VVAVVVRRDVGADVTREAWALSAGARGRWSRVGLPGRPATPEVATAGRRVLIAWTGDGTAGPVRVREFVAPRP
jgi:hypothetical protein